MKDLEKEVKIEIPPNLEGIFSNLAIITHNDSEFIIDFVQTGPGIPPRVKVRIYLTPQHAKRFLFALQDNIQKYEEQFGEIRLPPIIGGDIIRE
ncbi:DUF3467 domain-containing protein [bacterium]|nr:DUF3467 domain-containing protein [bacterium]